jgi:hypothetical protein
MRWLQRGFLTCEQHWPFAQTPSPRLPLPQLGRKRPAVELRKPRTPLVVVVLEAAIVDSSVSVNNDWEGSSTTTAHDGPTTTTRAANKLKHTFLATKSMMEVFLSFVSPFQMKQIWRWGKIVSRNDPVLEKVSKSKSGRIVRVLRVGGDLAQDAQDT